MRACLFFVFRRWDRLALSEPRPWARQPPPSRDLPDFLDVDVDHLTRSLGGDDLGFSVGFAVRVDEPATVQSQVPQDFRDRPTSNDDAVGSQFEGDA